MNVLDHATNRQIDDASERDCSSYERAFAVGHYDAMTGRLTDTSDWSAAERQAYAAGRAASPPVCHGCGG